MRIDDFVPGGGHRVFVPQSDLERFRAHIARMSPEDRARYSPLSAEKIAPGGGQYFLVGSNCSRDEVINFLTHVLVDD
jgi:hypothetical protein